MNNLYQIRTFSQKFEDALSWIQVHWKTILKFYAFFLIPVIIFQAFGQQDIVKISFATSGKAGSIAEGMTTWVALYYFFMLIGLFLSYALTMSLVKRDLIDRQAIDTLTVGGMWAEMKTVMPRLFFYGVMMCFFFSVFGFLMFVLTLVTPWTLVLTLPLLVFLGVALIPLLPHYLFTDEPIFEAFAHSLRLGKACWGGFLSTYVVMYLLTQLISLTCALPFYFILFAQLKFGAGLPAIPAFLLDGTSYLFGALLAFIGYLVQVATMVIAVFQYGHAVAKVDGETISGE